MHRTEGTNHNGNMFTDGPPGTTVEQNWLNSQQEEIANVIIAAGIALQTAATDTRDQLKTALDVLYAPISNMRGALVYRSSNQSVNDSTSADVIWQIEDYDTSDISDISVPGANPERLTVPSSATKVILTTKITWAADLNGYRSIAIEKNGSSSYSGAATRIWNAAGGLAGITQSRQLITPVLSVIGGDYFTVSVLQTSGGALNVGGGSGGITWFAMQVIE